MIFKDRLVLLYAILTHLTMWGPQQKSPRNCLSKTQVSANTKVDV
jgi:hypothetical protein